jgi:HECT-domain (ubiquitin-transferase)
MAATSPSRETTSWSTSFGCRTTASRRRLSNRATHSSKAFQPWSTPNGSGTWNITADISVLSSHESVDSMFNQQELQLLLGGVNSPIDVNDLRRNTVYGGSFSDDEPTIIAFWKVRTGWKRSIFFSNENVCLVSAGCREFQRRTTQSTAKIRHERRKASSSVRTLLCYILRTQTWVRSGFSGLVPKFSIRSAGEDENRLPTASTCANLLKVLFPFYTRLVELTPRRVVARHTVAAV